MKVSIAAILVFASISSAGAYTLKDLTPQDILVIGKALDQLPRYETDANNLYSRIQGQLVEQDKAAREAADKAAKEAPVAKPYPVAPPSQK